MSKYNKFVEVLKENFLGASIDNVTDYEIIEKFGEAYFKLGGNGIIHKEMEAIERLPIHEQD